MVWAHMSVVLAICSCDFTHFQLIVKGASCFSVSSFHLRLISMRLNFTAVWNSFETFCFSGALKTEEAFMTKLGPSPQRWGRLRSDGFHLWYVLVWAGGRVFRCAYLHVISICCKTHEICSVNSQIFICNSVTLWQGKSCSLSHKWPAHMEINYSINVNRITILI